MLPTVVVVMGVSGTGKSTVGRALAARLGWAFLDADDLHPRSNVEKMARGAPLDDHDRAPWLAALRVEIDAHVARGACLVLACSALREAYRAILAEGHSCVRFVHLVAPEPELARRLRGRSGHFAGPALLASQLATLEPPTDALTVDATRPIGELVDHVVDALAT